MGQTRQANLVLEFTSAGGADGAAYLDGFRFSFSPESNIILQPESPPISSDFVGNRPLGLSSVLVAVPALVSFGGTPFDFNFSGSGPASGTALSTVFITPLGSMARETLVKV